MDFIFKSQEASNGLLLKIISVSFQLMFEIWQSGTLNVFDKLMLLQKLCSIYRLPHVVIDINYVTAKERNRVYCQVEIKETEGWVLF